MLGEWFYHQRIRKATAVFGTLFNNISVVRKNSSGETISQIKVPLSYAPKRDFVSRISQMEMGENQERQIAIKLPRMSFEIVAFTYDAARQLPKISSRTVPSSTGASTAQQLYNPVPYNLSFQLHVYGRSQDDCLQVVEQILPYFTPQYNVTIKPLDDFDFLEDVPIKLDGVTYSDDYEGALENRRTIIYTLDFEMKISLYKGVPTATGPILDVTTNFYNMGTNDLLTFINCLANQPTGITGTTTEDGPASTGTFKLSNTLNPIYDSAGDVIGSPFSIESGDSASFGVSTIVGTTGAWSYTPNADFFGTDTFKIATDVGQNVTEKFDITVTVSSADGDAVDDVFNWSNDGTSLVMNVSANDTFETTGTITHAVETQPSAGTVTIIDSLAGTFRWTPPDASFTGSITWEYRAIPTEAAQSSEVAEVTINVT